MMLMKNDNRILGRSMDSSIVTLFATLLLATLCSVLCEGCSKSPAPPSATGQLLSACIAFNERCEAYTYHEGGMARYESHTSGSSERTEIRFSLKSMDGSPILTLSGISSVDDDSVASVSLDISVQQRSAIKLVGVPDSQAKVDGKSVKDPVVLEPGNHKVELKGKIETVYSDKK